MPFQAPKYDTSLIGQMVNPADRAGKFFTNYANQLREDEKAAKEEARYQTELARQKVLDARQKVQDDRATILWDEQQAEKEKLANAGLLLANYRPMVEMHANDAYNAAVADQVARGVPITARIQDFPLNLNQNAPVDINVKGGTTTGTAPVYKNVARQVVTGGEQIPTAQPTGVKPKGKAVVPATKGITLNNTGFVDLTPKKEGSILPKSTEVQYIDSPYMDTKTTRPSMNLNYPNTPQTKADKILSPTTPKQQEQSAKKVTTVMDKVLVKGGTGGGVPKLTQTEDKILQQIVGGIDPNATRRQDAKTELEGMLYGLGLNPKQVKEYSEGVVESVYGDKNDPVRTALASARLTGYGNNIKETNNLAEKIYGEQQANLRQTQALAQSAKQHKETLAARAKEAKTTESAFLKAFDSKSGALTAEMEADPVGFSDKQEKARRDKWAGRYKEKFGDEGWYDNIFNNQSDWIDAQIAAENLMIEKQRAAKKSK